MIMFLIASMILPAQQRLRSSVPHIRWNEHRHIVTRFDCKSCFTDGLDDCAARCDRDELQGMEPQPSHCATRDEDH